MQQPPLILVTNDDGVSAPGILHLASIAKNFGDVFVIAPDKPQSGMGHAITINSTLRIQKQTFTPVFLTNTVAPEHLLIV